LAVGLGIEGANTLISRALQTALRTLLKNTKGFKVNGELQFARMPEMGIISCPLEFEV